MEIFRLAPRSLAAFRIALSLLLLADLFTAFGNLEAFYTDAGVLPRKLLFEKTASTGLHWSLHFASDSAGWVAALLLCAVAAVAGLLVGWRTWGMTLASVVLIYSLHARNVPCLHGGHQALRVLLFWSLFLPLGGCWSVSGVSL